LPETLGELAGPVTGVVQLPPRLDWSDRMVFHLEDPAERNLMYERVIREATLGTALPRPPAGRVSETAGTKGWTRSTSFAEYGLEPEGASALRSRMHAWAKKISRG
jgi:hypothetical protein